MLIYLITYRKRNNEIFQRLITTCMYDVGDETSNGWIVLDIQVYYKGRFYKLDEFNEMFDKDYKQYIELQKKIEDRKKIVSKPLKFIGKKFNDIGNFIDKL